LPDTTSAVAAAPAGLDATTATSLFSREPSFAEVSELAPVALADFSPDLLCRSDLRERRFSFFSTEAGVVEVVFSGSSVDFRTVAGLDAAAGEDGDDGTDDAAEAGRKFSNVFTSNFRFLSRLQNK
jgi:hypothetical protein